MINGVTVIGKRYLVKGIGLVGNCIAISDNGKLVLDTANGRQDFTTEEVIELRVKN